MYTKAEIEAKLNTLEAAADPGLRFAGVISAIDLVGGSELDVLIPEVVS